MKRDRCGSPSPSLSSALETCKQRFRESIRDRSSVFYYCQESMQKRTSQRLWKSPLPAQSRESPSRKRSAESLLWRGLKRQIFRESQLLGLRVTPGTEHIGELREVGWNQDGVVLGRAG